MTMKTYRAKHLTGYEQPDGSVVWIDSLWTHVGTTRNGDGYEVVKNKSRKRLNRV